MVSESELRRTAALEAIAAMGTEDERLLHSLITRNEEVGWGYPLLPLRA
jgi:acetylornithine deacetylase/succinyl-diaminopimelate desuccinylase-like protein